MYSAAPWSSFSDFIDGPAINGIHCRASRRCRKTTHGSYLARSEIKDSESLRAGLPRDASSHVTYLVATSCTFTGQEPIARKGIIQTPVLRSVHIG